MGQLLNKKVFLMGFEVNFNNKPIITESKGLTDGGAGNLGYFEQEKEKKEKEKEKSIFAESGSNEDSFSKSGDEELKTENFSISSLIAEIIFSIKDWLRKTFGLKL